MYFQTFGKLKHPKGDLYQINIILLKVMYWICIVKLQKNLFVMKIFFKSYDSDNWPKIQKILSVFDFCRILHIFFPKSPTRVFDFEKIAEPKVAQDLKNLPMLVKYNVKKRHKRKPNKIRNSSLTWGFTKLETYVKLILVI